MAQVKATAIQSPLRCVKEPKSPRLRALLYYGASVALTILVLAAIPAIHNFPLRVPITYDGDGLFFTVLVRAIKEDGFLHATRIGAPFGSDIVDWPIGMWLPFGLMAGLLAAFGEPGTALNLYWLSTIVASALAATWSLRRLRVGAGLAFVLGALYGFQPYAFYRNVGHINLAFPLVPLLALLCLRVAGTHNEDETRAERLVTLCACLAQGFCYVYYTFFTCILLVVAAPVGWLRTGSRRLPLRAGVAILVLGTATVATVAPSALYWRRHGSNPELDYKTPADTDKYGLKLRHLLVPIADHPLPAVRELARRIENAAFPLDDENMYGKLGFIGSLGFLALLGITLGRSAGLIEPRDEDLDGAVVLTLSCLLVSTVGGLASFFSVLVSPDIRAYNRMVVFISFFSLLAAGILARRACARWPRAADFGWTLRFAALSLLLAVGLLDEIPMKYLERLRGGSLVAFDEDRSFTRRIEARLPRGAMVFQLPHATIPVDRSSLPPMVLYDPGRAYLHSETLRWSWGAIIGRTNAWPAAVANLVPRQMVSVLAAAGFSGVWIDRRGYTGKPRRVYTDLERELTLSSGTELLVSSLGRYSFVSIDQLRARLEREAGPQGLALRQREVLSDLPVLDWRRGCSDERPEGSGWVRVCDRSVFVVLKNPSTTALQVTLSGLLRPLGTGGLVRVTGPGFEDEVRFAGGAARYSRVIALDAGQRFPMRLEYEGARHCSIGAGDDPCFEIASMRAATRRLRGGFASPADEGMPAS